MNTWTAIVLTCPNQNTLNVYQNELKLRQKKGLINKECLLLSIEDPGAPIGSGGATLNALQIVAETLSAKKKCKVAQVELLANKYILIMHMGPNYPFDMIGKAFATLPLQDENYNLLTNFDLYYKMMTHQIAGLDDDLMRGLPPHSDPGVYVCSTDVLVMIPKNEKVLIRNSSVCVLSALGDNNSVGKNGTYVLDKDKKFVKNIFSYDENLDRKKESDKESNLITGIVYFNYEVARNLYTLLLYEPIEACSYVGIDNGAKPLYLSLFFDILLAACNGIEKKDYIEANYSTKFNVYGNKTIKPAVFTKTRSILWDTFHDESIKIRNITVNDTQCLHMDNESFWNHHIILEKFKAQNPECLQTSALVLSETTKGLENTMLINSIISESADLSVCENAYIFNSQFESCKVLIGKNCHLNDLSLKDEINLSIPDNLFIQGTTVDFVREGSVSLNIVFSITDNLNTIFDSENWQIMGHDWKTFSKATTICDHDLWSNNIKLDQRCLWNAKLFTATNLFLNDTEISYLNKYFWLDLLNSINKQHLQIENWRESNRLSLIDIFQFNNLSQLFEKRRFIQNLVNTELLITNVIEKKRSRFSSLIGIAIIDGYAHKVLEKFDKVALENCQNLFVLPRVMSFISLILCEMSGEFKWLRNGPSYNLKWLEFYNQINSSEANNRDAILMLKDLRKSWMERPDLIIRASRHYDGAMLAFIKQAVSKFQSDDSEFNRIILNPVDKEKEFEWAEAKCPARLDLAGTWSDTPPITYESDIGSSHTNVAIHINGVKPIGSRARILKDTKCPDGTFFIRIIMQDSCDSIEQRIFEFTELSELTDYYRPRAVACLAKAVFVFTKLVELDLKNSSLHEQLESKLGGSLELVTWTGLPQGCGLGTSSILISTALKVIWYLMGKDASEETLTYSTLIVEQLMTTGGGWQDQVAALYGGFKIVTVENRLPIEITVKEIQVSEKFLADFNSRLVLIYTGITRLAKDLLLNVLRNWYTLSPKIYQNINDLVKNSVKCGEILEEGNIEELRKCVSKNRMQKLVMAPESEPDTVQELIIRISPFVDGVCLAGAGGGGFMYALCKEPNTQHKIQNMLNSSNLQAKIYEVEVATTGIEFNLTPK